MLFFKSPNTGVLVLVQGGLEKLTTGGFYPFALEPTV